ncbi:MAG: electron transfer flavoprotein subunit beta/FixA family protein [bacterium]
MDIIVCIKQVQDPDIPPRDFKVDEEKMAVVSPANVPPVISTFDENAIEAAITLKEDQGGKITVLTVGGAKARDSLKKCLAMGCDEAVLLQDEAFEGSDAFGVSRILAGAVRKLGSFDVILCGRLTSDWSYGATGLALAEALGLPSVTQLQSLEAVEGGIRCERVLEDGAEVVEVQTPCLLTTSNEINTPRLPSVKGILMASRKEIPVWGAAETGVDPAEVGAGAATLELTRLYKPVFTGQCEFIEGESLEEAAENLALRLREEKII